MGLKWSRQSYMSQEFYDEWVQTQEADCEVPAISYIKFLENKIKAGAAHHTTSASTPLNCPECGSEAYKVLYCKNKDCRRFEHG